MEAGGVPSQASTFLLRLRPCSFTPAESFTTWKEEPPPLCPIERISLSGKARINLAEHQRPKDGLERLRQPREAISLTLPNRPNHFDQNRHTPDFRRQGDLRLFTQINLESEAVSDAGDTNPHYGGQYAKAVSSLRLGCSCFVQCACFHSYTLQCFARGETS